MDAPRAAREIRGATLREVRGPERARRRAMPQNPALAAHPAHQEVRGPELDCFRAAAQSAGGSNGRWGSLIRTNSHADARQCPAWWPPPAALQARLALPGNATAFEMACNQTFSSVTTTPLIIQ